MSTPLAPARLAVRFASDVATAVVIRRGPSDWCQLILWNLSTDEFTRGQWVHGVVKSAALSPNGEHIAVQIQTKGKKYSYYSLVSRPPYFTALAIEFGPGSYTTIAFTRKSELVWNNHVPIDVRAPNACPYPMLHRDLRFDELPVGSGLPTIDWSAIKSPYAVETPGGRHLWIADGCLHETVPEGENLLLDTCSDVFEEVKAPDWALSW